MRRVAGFLLAAALVASGSAPLSAYLKLGSTVNGRVVTLKWTSLPIRYFVSNVDVPQVTASQLQGAVSRAFASWDAAPNTQVSSQFAGFTQAGPIQGDGVTTLGFVSRPDSDRTLGATNFIINTQTGAILESDIFFNSIFPWSVAPAGEAGRFDLESIALHEIGHLHGLGHSAIGETELLSGGRRVISAEAVMFPIAFTSGNIADRTLKADDIAGISEIYPSSTFLRNTGSVSGKVTKNGTGVVGAHITAFNPNTGKLVSGFTLSDDGAFTIAGLEPGPQVLRAEPLDDGDIGSFFDPSTNVDVNFRVKFYEKLVVVPRGGGTSGIVIQVVPK
jgi:Matrixin/Carboxypeptidase regulatory-like domain